MDASDLLPWRWHSRDRNAPARRGGEHPLGTLQGEINQVFDDFLRRFESDPFGGSPLSVWQRLGGGAGGGFLPALDVEDRDGTILVTAELPGLDEKDIDLSVEPGALRLRGEKRDEAEKEEKGVRWTERSYGRFERLIPLPEGVDVDQVEARFEKGVLKITIPRDETVRPRRHVPVSSSDSADS